MDSSVSKGYHIICRVFYHVRLKDHNVIIYNIRNKMKNNNTLISNTILFFSNLSSGKCCLATALLKGQHDNLEKLGFVVCKKKQQGTMVFKQKK